MKKPVRLAAAFWLSVFTNYTLAVVFMAGNSFIVLENCVYLSPLDWFEEGRAGFLLMIFILWPLFDGIILEYEGKKQKQPLSTSKDFNAHEAAEQYEAQNIDTPHAKRDFLAGALYVLKHKK